MQGRQSKACVRAILYKFKVFHCEIDGRDQPSSYGERRV